MASRAEGKAYPGTICITSDMYLAIRNEFSQLGNPATEDIGTHSLKGIEGVHKLMLLTPASFADRLGKTNPAPRRSAYETNPSPHPRSSSPTSKGTGHHASPVETTSCVSAVTAPTLLPPSSTGVQKKTGLTLVRGQVTVAVCRLIDTRNDNMFENCNTMVRLVVEAASQTDGVVGNVTGRTMTIMWNASKSCKMHTTAALRFAAQLERRSSKIMRVGVSSGEMLFGNVGTQKKRFHTTFGRPLEAAEAAADHALHLGAFCLLADCTADCKLVRNPAISPFVRVVDMWMDDDFDKQIVLLELMTAKLIAQLEDSWGTVASGDDPELERHNARVVAAIEGDKNALEALKQACAMHTHDIVLKRTFTLVAQATEHKPNYRVRVRFTSLPEGVFSTQAAPLSSVGPRPFPSPRRRGLSRASISPPPGVTSPTSSQVSNRAPTYLALPP
eukprot:TRINITY_DN5241_c0_g1_i3.p1 TRINITY_DN5241_c0_g1~~TRINITY_DN5241_c0_g1_i3.p1  ORF type:complete len:519 (+),score=113.04 TRINITY_DN5241_c0_g1_i3:223-1557(+)